MATVIQSTHKEINWGGVLKGVAIVTGVVVACVAGYYGFNAIADSAIVGDIMNNDTVEALLKGTANSFATAWDWLGTQATWLGGKISAGWAAIPGTFGMSGALSPEAGKLLTDITGGIETSKLLGGAGALVVGGAALSIANPTLHNTTFTTTVPDSTILPDTHALAAHQANMMGMHHAHEAAQHAAADHATEQHAQTGGWAKRYANKAAAVQSVAPRDSSFAAQLNSDTAKLDQALSK